MLKLDIGIFRRMNARHNFIPQHAGLHDVALLGGRNFLLAGARQFEGDTADALDLVGVIDLRIDAALLAIAEIGDGLGFTEIDATRQFTDDQDVEAFDHLALERRSIGQCRIADRRAQIGEQPEVLAQAQQARFRANVIGHLVPFGATHRAKQHGVRGHGKRHMIFRDRLAMGIIGTAANQAAGRFESGDALGIEPGDDVLDFLHHFRADAVAWKQEQIMGGHVRFRQLKSGAMGSGRGLVWQVI